MNAFWFYPIHLTACLAGITMLEILRRRGVPWPQQAAAGTLICAAMSVFVFSISEPHDLFSDFYKAYYPAANAVLAGNGDSGLAATMQRGAGGFVNLPILAWLFAPFGLLPSAAAGYVFFLLGVAATIGAWYCLSRLAGLDRHRSLLLLFIFAACGPLHNSLREGNTTHFILLLLALGLLALRRDRDFLAGLIFGFAALIKLPLLLLGLYFFSRGRWRVAIGGAAVCSLAGFASLGMFGWDLHVFWYEHSIKPYAETPLAAFNVQSVQGFFARLQHADRYLLDWTPHSLHPAVKLASRVSVWLLMLAVTVVIGLPRRWRRGRTQEASERSIMELEVCIVVMLALMISTVSWSHYYLWLLLPAALMIGGVPSVLASRELRMPGWPALIMALPPVLVIHFPNPLLAKIYGCVAVSHYLFAGGLLLAMFLYAGWRSAPPKPEPSRK